MAKLSRKKRKRNRCRAEANAAAPGGGWGQGLPATRKDLQNLQRAIRGGWGVPDAVRPHIVADLCEAMDGERPHLTAAAVRTVVIMEEQNQRAEHADMQRPWKEVQETRGSVESFVSHREQSAK